MTAQKISKPFNIQSRAGRNMRPSDEEVLRVVCRYLDEKGITVLSTLFAREPGMMTFFATCYLTPPAGKIESMPPFGCVRVSFLRNGQVRFTTMGLKVEHREYIGDSGIEWK